MAVAIDVALLLPDEVIEKAKYVALVASFLIHEARERDVGGINRLLSLR